MSPLALEPLPLPLRLDDTGVVRVGGTRVTLDTVVTAFQEGATAEEIAQQYPLELPHVYAVISFYLTRRPEVDAYLTQRRALAQDVRRENESRFDSRGIRERLMARRNVKP
jgi:uncharacterized protein (DUF433 family)